MLTDGAPTTGENNRHDVFLSHSSKDKVVADAICHAIEANGIRCWAAPRDVRPGQEWAEAIIHAINGAKVFVLVYSEHSNASPQIRREIERAAHRELPIIPFRISDTAPNETLEYFISTPHWLDAVTPPLEQHIARLSGVISRMLGGQAVDSPPEAAPMASAGLGRTRKRGGLFPRPVMPVLAVSGALLVAGGVAAWIAPAVLPAQMLEYHVILSAPVQGVSTGTEVMFDGLDVGNITKISWDTHDAGLVVATATIRADTPVRRDSFARVLHPVNASANYLEISSGSESQPLLRDTVQSGQPPVIDSVPDQLDIPRVELPAGQSTH